MNTDTVLYSIKDHFKTNIIFIMLVLSIDLSNTMLCMNQQPSQITLDTTITTQTSIDSHQVIQKCNNYIQAFIENPTLITIQRMLKLFKIINVILDCPCCSNIALDRHAQNFFLNKIDLLKKSVTIYWESNHLIATSCEIKRLKKAINKQFIKINKQIFRQKNPLQYAAFSQLCKKWTKTANKISNVEYNNFVNVQNIDKIIIFFKNIINDPIFKYLDEDDQDDLLFVFECSIEKYIDFFDNKLIYCTNLYSNEQQFTCYKNVYNTIKNIQNLIKNLSEN